MLLSERWKIVLQKLADYGETGINENSFCELYGGQKHSFNNTVKEALNQMYHMQAGLWEYHPDKTGKQIIRITAEGLKAIENE